MNNKKIKIILISFFMLLFASSFMVEKSYSYTATLQEIEQSSSNQLLRISFEPIANSKTINVNLYTTNGSPQIKEKNYGNSTFIIELNNTIIATTNNVNIDNVSDLIKSVKIVPYLNTSNPLVPGMARVIINGKEPGLNYKIQLNQIQNSKISNSKVNAKVYYPPGSNNKDAQNLAVFSPLDDKTLSDIPEERLIINNSLIAQASPDDASSLQLSPPSNSQSEVELPGFDEFINASDITTVPPVESNEATSADQTTSTGEEGQSPQPSPSTSQQQPQLPQGDHVKSIIPKNLASILMGVCFIVIVIILFIGSIIVLKLIKKKKNKPEKKSSDSSNLKNIEEIAEVQNLKEVSIEDFAAKHNIEALDEEIEEIEMLDSNAINGNKTLYLVKFAGKVSLIGNVEDNIFVLNTFHPDEMTDKSPTITSSKEGNVLGKEIFLVKVSNWQGVVVSQNNQLSLHTDLTVE